jgi:hypothetical protein
MAWSSKDYRAPRGDCAGALAESIVRCIVLTLWEIVKSNSSGMLETILVEWSRLVGVLLVDWILAAPKLRVKLESFVNL